MSLLDTPIAVYAILDSTPLLLTRSALENVWGGHGVELSIQNGKVSLRSQAPIQRVIIRWKRDHRHIRLVLGDQWERSYGDLEWRGISPSRVMPWYCLAFDGQTTFGFGVKVRPNAFAHWHLDEQGISLWLDVRCGGSGVTLGDRTLEVAEIVTETSHSGMSSFDFATAFCKLMSPTSRTPEELIYGINDWYYAYGNNDPDVIIRNTEVAVNLSPKGGNRPFTVVDAGWSPHSWEFGPYDVANDRWKSMPHFAERAKATGAKPGIWVRPLTRFDGHPDSWQLGDRPKALDPSHPEVLSYVRRMMTTVGDWGFELIKHDFSTFDIFDKWGFEMGAQLTRPGWHFQDRSKTTAEIINQFYAAIREGAGDAVVIGCNTVSHMSAGVFEANRIGDDTSGRHWDRNRRMGVNTLAFRACQHGSFYAADADVCAITPDLDWAMAERWLDLVSHSGTPLFVSMDERALGEPQKAALKRAFESASRPQTVARPLDWMQTTSPRHWRIGDKDVEFDWIDTLGPWPLSD